MTKAQGQSAKKRAKKKPAAGKQKKAKPVNMGELREEITNLVGGEAVGMVNSTINEADKGHYPAMKYLFEMVGLYPEVKQEEAAPQGEGVLAKTLLRRLALPEEAAPEEKVTKESEGAATEELK